MKIKELAFREVGADSMFGCLRKREKEYFLWCSPSQN